MKELFRLDLPSCAKIRTTMVKDTTRQPVPIFFDSTTRNLLIKTQVAEESYLAAKLQRESMLLIRINHRT